MRDEAKVEEVDALMQEWRERGSEMSDDPSETFGEWMVRTRPELAETLNEMTGRKAPTRA